MKVIKIIDSNGNTVLPVTHASICSLKNNGLNGLKTNVQDALDELYSFAKDIVYGKIIPLNFNTGYINGAGSISYSKNILYSDEFNIEELQYVYISAFTENVPNVINNACAIAFYNLDHSFISSVMGPDRTKNGYVDMKITIPNEAIYARVNRWVDDSYNGVCFGDFYCLKEQSLYNIIDEIKKGTLNSNLNAPNVDFMPIAKVVISSETLIPNEGNNTIPPLNTNKNVIGTDVEGNIDGSVKLVFTKGSETWTDNIAISYQGSSSINDLKKGFSVDFEEKHRLGQWLAFDSFHLKAYYTDWLHARDLVSNLLLEQIYLSRPINVRRPFMLFNDFVANDYRISMDGGAKCHIDGFPISLYINDKYWGLYSFNIKKDRRNYYMNKNNNHHILVDVILEGIMSSAGDVKWSSCEFRNPKGLMNADGTEYDSDNPKEIEDSDVKKSWQRFVSFLYSINDDTTKAECDNYINSQEFIDNIVFSDTIYNIDVFRNNTLWACWDAKVVDGVATEGHWSPLLYDLDKSFGKVENGWPGSTNGFINDPQSDVFAQYADISCPELIKLRKIYSKEIEDRYKELRSLGIFSINNITNLFSKWTLAVGADEYEREIERWPSLPTLQYDSVGRCIDFLKSRFNFLDLKYGYLKAI